MKSTDAQDVSQETEINVQGTNTLFAVGSRPDGSLWVGGVTSLTPRSSSGVGAPRSRPPPPATHSSSAYVSGAGDRRGQLRVVLGAQCLVHGACGLLALLQLHLLKAHVLDDGKEILRGRDWKADFEREGANVSGSPWDTEESCRLMLEAVTVLEDTDVPMKGHIPSHHQARASPCPAPQGSSGMYVTLLPGTKHSVRVDMVVTPGSLDNCP